MPHEARRSAVCRYLRVGASPLHGVSAGPMSPVIHVGLAAVPDADIQAEAVYFADIDRAAVLRVRLKVPHCGG